MSELYLHVPTLDDLWFREKLCADPATMAYNGVTVRFPQDIWRDWLEVWTGDDFDRFYAYVARKSDGAFIGEVNFHYSARLKKHLMGIVLGYEYRGHGYSKEALLLLIDRAKVCGVKVLLNDFGEDRAAAMKIHTDAGFKIVAENGENRILKLDL